MHVVCSRVALKLHVKLCQWNAMQEHHPHRKCSIFEHAKDGGHIVAIVRYGKKLRVTHMVGWLSGVMT